MNRWKRRRVFVTGCNGFVGGWLVKNLIEHDAKVVGLIRDIVPNSSLSLLGCLDKMNIVYGDVEDYELIERALNEYDIDCIFHLAAQSQVGAANRSPLSTFKTNILGTLNILEAARSLTSIKAIVVASSDKAYGSHKRLPYREDYALKGAHPYDASKACADIISQAYHNMYKLPVAIARCGNIFGPTDLNLNRIVPDTIRALCMDRRPLIRSDGKYIRDYLYISDAVSAYLCLANGILGKTNGVVGEAFNFGSGKPLSVIELVNLIIKISGKLHKPKILNTATGEIRKQYISGRKAKNILGWMPQVRIESALEDTYRWYEDFFMERV